MMKKLALSLLFGILGVGVYGQTIKSLGYNTTNGQVVAATNVVWTNAFSFSTNVAAGVRTNLGLGWGALTNTNASNFQTAIGLGATNVPTFNGINVGTELNITLAGMTGYGSEIDLEERDLSAGNGFDWNLNGSGFYTVGVISFANTTNAAATRTNLGLGSFSGEDGYAVLLDANTTNTALSTEDGEVLIHNKLTFNTSNAAAQTRTNLGLGWSALTNTNASNFRSAIELSSTNSVSFSRVIVDPTASASAFRFGTNNTGLWAGPDADYRSFSVRAGGSVLLFFQTNRVLFSTNVDFDGGSSGIIAATTRTNLGLGNGITTNRTFVSYDGTNYTTNSVTISNGIITGWSQ